MFGAAFGIGIGQLRIGQQRFERAVTRQLGAPDHFHLRGVQRQEQNVLEIVVVICFAHRREIHHFWNALLQFVGVGCAEPRAPRRALSPIPHAR